MPPDRTEAPPRLRALGVPFGLASAYVGAQLATLGKPARGRVLLAALAEAVGR